MDYQKLTFEFIEKLQELNKIQRQKDIDMELHGEPLVLRCIYQSNGGIWPKEIGEFMGVTSARVANVLNNLEDKGLITREIDKDDRRNIIVKVTQEGEIAAKESMRQFMEKAEVVLNLLGEKDAKEYIRITGKLAEIIANIELCKEEL